MRAGRVSGSGDSKESDEQSDAIIFQISVLKLKINIATYCKGKKKEVAELYMTLQMLQHCVNFHNESGIK